MGFASSAARRSKSQEAGCPLLWAPQVSAKRVHSVRCFVWYCLRFAGLLARTPKVPRLYGCYAGTVFFASGSTPDASLRAHPRVHESTHGGAPRSYSRTWRSTSPHLQSSEKGRTCAQERGHDCAKSRAQDDTAVLSKAFIRSP